MKLAEMEAAIAAGDSVQWSGLVDVHGQLLHRFEIVLTSTSNSCVYDGKDEPQIALEIVKLLRLYDGDLDGHLIGVFVDGFMAGRGDLPVSADALAAVGS